MRNKSPSQIVYQCVRCGYRETEAVWSRDGITFKCPQCSFKVAKKIRPPIVKRIKVI